MPGGREENYEGGAMTHVFGTTADVKKRQSQHTSEIGSGRVGDSGSAQRQEVIEKVKVTLLGRMDAANKNSEKDAKEREKILTTHKEHFDLELDTIREVHHQFRDTVETLETLKVGIKEMEAEDSDYMKAKRQTESAEAKYAKLETGLEKRKSMMRRKADIDATRGRDETIKAGISMLDNVLRSGADPRGEAAQRKDELVEEQEARDKNRQEVEAYYKKHRMNEKRLAKKEAELEEANQERKASIAALTPHQSIYWGMKNTAHDLERQKIDLQMQFLKLNGEMLKEAEGVQEKLDAQADAAKGSYGKFSRDYDNAAMKYYVLARKQADTSDNPNARPEIAPLSGDKAKNIQEYIGIIPDMATQVGLKINQIIQNPEHKRTIEIKVNDDRQLKSRDAKLNFVDPDKKIKYHRGISTTAFKEGSGDTMKAKLDSSFRNRKASGAVTGTALSADKRNAHGFYNVAADTVDIKTVQTAKAATVDRVDPATGQVKTEVTKDLRGAIINQDFVSEDDSRYQSEKDLTFGSRREIGKAASDLSVQLREDIRNSAFFNHIYSEMIEYYMSYPGDDYGLVQKAPAAQPQGQPLQPQSVAGNPPQAASGGNPPAASAVDLSTAADGAAVAELYKRVKEAGASAPQPAVAGSPPPAPAQTVQAVITAAKTEVGDAARWNKVLYPKLIRLIVAVNEKPMLDKLKDVVAQDPSTVLKNAVNQNNLAKICLLCDRMESEQASTFAQIMDAELEFFGGDGIQVSDSSRAADMNGFINWGQMQEIYEQGNSMWALITKRTQRLKDLENEIGLAEENGASKETLAKLNGEKSGIEDEINHGPLADTLSLFNSILGIINGVKDCIGMIKEKNLMSEEHSDEKALGSLYVTWADGVFDAGEKIFGLAKSIFECIQSCFGLAGKVLAKADPAAKVFNLMESSFKIAKNIYELVQNSRKYHNISKAEDTINTDEHKAARQDNPQVLLFLASSRRKAGKDIAGNVQTVVTSSLDISSEVTDPVSSTVLGMASKFIGFLGSLITNGIYRRREEKAAFVAAFGEEKAGKYMNYSGTDGVLQRMVGIKSHRHLASVTRIMSAIDTHVLLKDAKDGPERNLVKTAMGAFYPDKGDGYRSIPFTAILGNVGEGDDWRTKLASALA